MEEPSTPRDDAWHRWPHGIARHWLSRGRGSSPRVSARLKPPDPRRAQMPVGRRIEVPGVHNRTTETPRSMTVCFATFRVVYRVVYVIM